MTNENENNGMLIRADHLCKSYHGRKVVDDVSISVKAGEVVGLLGPNGAGKTTSFYMVMGLIRPDSGEIAFRDVDITHMPMYKRARMGMGYLAQEPSIFRKLTVAEILYNGYASIPASPKQGATGVLLRREHPRSYRVHGGFHRNPGADGKAAESAYARTEYPFFLPQKALLRRVWDAFPEKDGRTQEG